MSQPSRNDKSEYQRELKAYVIGLVLALALSAIPFACVAWRWLSPLWMLAIVFCAGLIQMAVHFRYFLHIGPHSHRDDLNLLLFTAVIVLLLVGGTLIIMFNLHQRMIQ